jgi:TP901 family phage tail tape measure protein
MAGKVVQIAELRVKGDKANQVLRELDKTARSLNQTAKRTEKNMKSLSSGMNTLKGVLGSAGVLGALYALQAGFRATFDEMRTFGKGIAEINTLLDDNQKITEKTRSTFLDFSAQYGQSAQSQVKGFYDIVSAGVSDTQQALGVLEVANKAAVAGVTDVATTADVLTSSMNAYASAGLSAAKASDILFATVRAGKTTMPELASNVGKVAPIAASAGLKFSEMAGALAQLTKVGLSTDEAATGLKALLTGVIKPAPQAIEMAKKLGIQFDTAAIRSKGLAGFIAEITEKTGGNEKALAKLFPNVRALSGVLSLASGGADAFAKTLKDVADAGGATETAFEKVKKSLDFKLNQLNAEFSKLGIILHTKLLPVYEAVIKGFKWLIDNATAIAGAIGVVAGAIALLNAKFIALKLLVLTNPIGLLVAGLATAAFLVIKNWDKIKLFLEKLFTIWIPNWIDKAKIKFIELQQKGFGGKILKNLAGLWEKFFNFLIAGYNNSIGKITGKKIPPIKLTFEGDEAKSKIDEINKRIEARLLKEKQINDELKKRLDIPQPSAPTGAGPTGPADPGSVGGEIEKTTDSLKSFKAVLLKMPLTGYRMP